MDHDGDYDMDHDRDHDGDYVENHEESIDRQEMILEFCRIPRTRKEIMDYLKLFNRGRFNERYMRPLLDSGKLRMTLPDKPTLTSL